MSHEATDEINQVELQRRGFDVKAACKVVGNESVLLLVAPEFIKELKVCMYRMEGFIREKSHNEIRLMVHAIKGSAATLCHYELIEALEELEKVCVARNAAEIEEKYKNLCLVYLKILGEG